MVTLKDKNIASHLLQKSSIYLSFTEQLSKVLLDDTKVRVFKETAYLLNTMLSNQTQELFSSNKSKKIYYSIREFLNILLLNPFSLKTLHGIQDDKIRLMLTIFYPTIKTLRLILLQYRKQFWYAHWYNGTVNASINLDINPSDLERLWTSQLNKSFLNVKQCQKNDFSQHQS